MRFVHIWCFNIHNGQLFNCWSPWKIDVFRQRCYCENLTQETAQARISGIFIPSPWKKIRLSFHNCLSCVCNFQDHKFISLFAVQIHDLSYIHLQNATILNLIDTQSWILSASVQDWVLNDKMILFCIPNHTISRAISTDNLELLIYSNLHEKKNCR